MHAGADAERDDDDDDDEGATRRYYASSLFPVEHVHRWASREWAGVEAHKREWGWEGFSGAPFVRWKSCATPDALHKMVSQRGVGKINLGAVYATAPEMRFKQSSDAMMLTTTREFIVDIDLDDYGGVGKDDLAWCDHAWPLVAVGLEVAWRALTEHFGFQHVLKVYSGRRGGHLWVCDKRAAAMSDEVRDAVIKWMQPKEVQGGKRLWEYLAGHPNFTEMYAELVLPFFLDTALKPINEGGLGMLEVEFQRRAFVYSVGLDRDPKCKAEADKLALKAANAVSPREAFDVVDDFCFNNSFRRLWLAGAVWGMVGPRLDVNVSTKTNHTLKIPFSVHPKTLRLSVPILHDTLLQFPVARRAPTVHALFGPDSKKWLALLKATTEAFGAFVDKLNVSDTERWKPPSYDYPPAKRLKAHDLRGNMVLPSDPVAAQLIPIVDFQRRAWILTRYFTAYAPADKPDTVRLTMTSTERERRIVQPGKFLAVTGARHRSLEDVAESVGDVVAYARQHPDQGWHCMSHCYIAIVGMGTEFDASTNARLDRLAPRLAEPWEVCCLETKWGPDAICCFLKQKLAPLLDDVRLL